MVRKLVLAVTAASALMSSNMVQALGVGEINLRSALNQPLEAEIELLQIRDLSSTEIRSTLASPDDFGRAGVDRSFFLTDLTFTPVVQPDGKAYIRVTSSRPVKEPYLNFLMEVRWPSGRVLREFTLLLDPPLYEPTPITFSAPTAPSTAVNSGTVRPPVSTSAPVPLPIAAPEPRTATASTTAAAVGGQRQTNRSDTLWAIALEARPEGSSVHQTMLAIQDLNPGAFIGNNINTLKAGQTLILPNAEQAAIRSQAEAVAEVNNQTSAWQSRQSTRAPAQRQLDARARSVASDAPSQVRREDSLRLVAGDAESSEAAGSASGGEDDGLRGALEQTREQLDSAEQAKAELTDRLADVEGQLETLQRLLTLKDTQLAALQRELAKEGTLPDILPTPEDQVVAEDGFLAEALADVTLSAAGEAEVDQLLEQQPEPAELGDLAQSGSEGEDGSQGDAENDEEQVVLAPIAAPADQSDAGSNDSAPPSAPETPAPTAPAAQMDATQSNSPEALLQRFMQNQTLLLGTGAVALLLLLLIFRTVARRNARGVTDSDDNDLPQLAAHDNAAAAEEGDDFNVALADAPDEIEVAQDTRDPLVVVDELIAYDELNEAADLLEEAIEEEPERTDLRLKMMEVEARLENQEGYTIQLEALRRMGVADSAVEMMNARYPLMAAGLVTGATLLDSNADVGQPSEDAPEQPLLDGTDVQEDPLELDADFDFADFGLEEDTAASLADASEQEIGFDLDFDLDEGSSADAAPVTEPTVDLPSEPLTFDEPQVDSSQTSSVIDDFDLNLDEELQADNLLAELEAMGTAEVSTLQPGADALAVVEDDSFTLTDDDLASFEAQLQSEMQSESGIETVASHAEESGDKANTYHLSADDEDLMGDGLDDDFGFLSDTDECATKLDLARAYIDMGDEEGARDILAEVLDEGTEQQQQDAREMMGQLG